MKSIFNSISKTLPIVYIALVSFGSTVSIGRFGLYVFLFLVLVLQAVSDLINGRRIQIQTTDSRLYIGYIIIFYICSLFNGDADYGINSILVNYLLCLLIYSIISKDITSKIQINRTANVLLILMLLNCLVTISQYYNVPTSWGIWYFFNDADTVKQAAIINEMTAGSQMIGKDYLFCPGIFPSQVYNGYIVGSLSAIAIFKLYNAKTVKQRIIGLLYLAVIAYSLIIIQQRMAFLLFIAAWIVMMFTKNKTLTLILAFSLLILYLSYGFGIGEEQIGRLADLGDKTREHLYTGGIEYITNHLLEGGRKEFSELYSLSVHNVFLNAFIYGGIFGAILIIIIYIRMCVKSIVIIFKNMNRQLPMTVMFAYALLIYNIISMTHNNSLLTGEPIIWVLYALMLLSLKIEKHEKRTT